MILIEIGLIERVGRRRLLLSQKYHQIVGKPGVYTRKAGLDRATNKALLLKHLTDNPGAPLADLCEVLPSLTVEQVRTLIKEMKADGLVFSEGRTRAGRWYTSSGWNP